MDRGPQEAGQEFPQGAGKIILLFLVVQWLILIYFNVGPHFINRMTRGYFKTLTLPCKVILSVAKNLVLLIS